MSSSVNLGSQNLTFAYRESAKAYEFNHFIRDILKPGIYSGGVVAYYNPTTLSIPPYSALFDTKDSLSNERGTVKVEADATYLFEVFSGTPPADDDYYVYGLLTWAESPSSFVGYGFRSTSSGAVANEVIFGTFTVSGGVITTTVSAGGRTIGQTTDIQGMLDRLSESYGFTYSVSTGTGTAEYPQYILYTKGTTIIRLDITWSLMTNLTTKKPDSIVYQLSLDSGTTYANLFTKTYSYSSDLLTGVSWS